MSDNSSKEIRSTLTNEGILELSIVNAERPVPGDDEVLLKIEASPINPSDLALLITFAADLDSLSVSTGRCRILGGCFDPRTCRRWH